MKKKLFVFLLVLNFCLPVLCQQIDYTKIDLIIQAFKSKSPEIIASYIVFPLKRHYPLPAVNNEQEFISRFNEIVDSAFLEFVGNSNAIKDWEEIGWRGIAFNNGEIWLSENYKIRTINYETTIGKKRLDTIINEQKRTLPLEYQNFDTPIYEWKSKGYYYRLDEINNKYRLLIWDINKNKILNVYSNGEYEPDGNIGFFHIDWILEDEIIRIQNTDYKNDWSYFFFVYDKDTLLNNERAKAKYVDGEIK